MQEIDVARAAIAFAFFIFASISDWRTRRVKNVTWIALGAMAFGLLWLELILSNAPLLEQSLMLPTLFLFVDVFWERGEGLKTPVGLIGASLYIASFAWIIYAGYTVLNGTTVWTPEIGGLIVAFAMVVVFEIFYMFDVIKGGADAKALICLAILFPWYPQLVSGLPAIQPTIESIPIFFSFALSVLFIGALISMFVPLYFLAKNLRSGKRITGRSLLGFQLPIDRVGNDFVWLIEWVENGELKFSSRKPRDSEHLKEDLSALAAMGKNEVWVTYKIPFIIPLTAGIIVIMTLGNPLFLLY